VVASSCTPVMAAGELWGSRGGARDLAGRRDLGGTTPSRGTPASRAGARRPRSCMFTGEGPRWLRNRGWPTEAGDPGSRGGPVVADEPGSGGGRAVGRGAEGRGGGP
jgi:hypothetical protein